MANSSKFRADQIGSLMRPPEVLEARRRLDDGMIEADELRSVEDGAIAKVVKMQQDARIDILTDGEFRRTDFRTGFTDAFEGFAVERTEKYWHSADGDVLLPTKQLYAEGKLEQKRRITDGEATYLKSITGDPIKSTLIAPGFIVDRFYKEGVTDKVYKSREDFAAEVAEFTRREIEALIAEGVSYVQLDNPGYAAFVDEPTRERLKTEGRDPDEAFQLMLDTDIAAVKGIERPPRVSVGMHVCRGNQKSYWLAEGSYELIAEKLFGTLPVDRFLVEYDDERSGGFEPLRFVPEGVMVVLGLISSKDPALEDLDAIQAQIDDAAQYVDMDDLSISPQCGFASVALGANDLTEQDEFNKLQLVSDIGLATWGIEL